MESIRNCPYCGSSKTLFRKYFGTPLWSFKEKTSNGEFEVEIEMDICMDCNAVYTTKWKTTRLK